MRVHQRKDTLLIFCEAGRVKRAKMTDELDEGQKKFIELAGITTAEFVRLKNVYEKGREACQSEAPREYGLPEPDRRTLQMLAEMQSIEESLKSIEKEEDQPDLQDKSPERYVPTKEATKEILEIAKEQGDEIDDRSLKLLDDVFSSGIAPKGDAISHIKNAATVAKDMTDFGKLYFDKYAKSLGTFGVVASLLKDILTWSEPKKKDPVLEELGVLKNQLDALSGKMVLQFDELKTFMVEQAFFTEYADSASTLLEYMTRTMQYVETQSLDDFNKHYDRLDPEYCVTRMLKVLERDSSNPLRVSMKNGELPTKIMFEKWKQIIESTLTQFLMLEYFACGLTPGNDRKKNIITEKIAHFKTLVNKWENEYLNDKTYRDRVLTFVKRIQQDGSYPKDEHKAEIIYNKLQGMLTNDSFYVVVFHKDIHYHYKCAKDDQLIVSLDNGSFHVFVFCVRTHSPQKAAQLRSRLKELNIFNEEYCSPFVTLNSAMRDWVDERVNKTVGKMNGYGFYMSVGSGCVATRWPKQFKDSEFGPGHFTYDTTLIIGNVLKKCYHIYCLVTEP